MRRVNLKLVSRKMLLALLFVVALSYAGSCHAQQPKAIEELLEERLATATKIHDLAVKRYEMLAKGATMVRVLHAKAMMLSIRLELSKTKEQRIKNYEAALKDAKEWETRSAENEEALGDAGGQDGLEAKAFRLEIQTALEKAKL